MVSVGWVTVTRPEIKLSNPSAEAVMRYVPAVVGVPTLARSEMYASWWRVTLAGVTVTMLAGEPATVKCTVMSVLAPSLQNPHLAAYARTEMGCGALDVVRVGATPDKK